MKKYKYELIITIVGGLLTFIELFLDKNFSVFILSITIILDIAVLGVRFLILDGLKNSSDLYKFIYDIENDIWREEAFAEYNTFMQKMREMSNGKRKIDSTKITAEEIRLISQSQKSIYCTYYADSIVKLEMRLNTHSKYNPLNSINKSYDNIASKKINKKRIFILDKIDLNNPKVINILIELNNYYSDLNFSTKFLLFSKMKEINIPYVGNMILSDNYECTTCIDKTIYPGDYMKKEYYLTREVTSNNYINPSIVSEYTDNFMRMWEIAVSIGEITG